jgi:hypothetical protein
VLLLASYHMANPGADQFNLEADDVLSPRRQAELAALVDRLSQFEPTKVAVEASYADTSIASSYSAYLRGDRELSRNETQQIGFRLARQSGHERIYPIDYRMGMDMGSIGPLVASSPAHGARMGELQAYGEAAIAQMGAWLAAGTVSDMLYQLNRPETLRATHWPYTTYFLPIVEGDDFAGADLVAGWYQRNLRIYANLSRVTVPGDRVVVIFGAGHVPILKHLVEQSRDYCYENPLPYLR